MNAKLTAYALNELPPEERTALEAEMEADPRLRAEAEEMKTFCALLNAEVAGDEKAALTVDQRVQVLRVFTSEPQQQKKPARSIWRHPAFLVPTAIAACTTIMLVINLNQGRPGPLPSSSELQVMQQQNLHQEKELLAASPSESVRVTVEKKPRPEGMTPAPGMPATPVLVESKSDHKPGTVLDPLPPLLASNAPVAMPVPAPPTVANSSTALSAERLSGNIAPVGSKVDQVLLNGGSIASTSPSTSLNYAGTGTLSPAPAEKDNLGRVDLRIGARPPLERFDWGSSSFGINGTLAGDSVPLGEGRKEFHEAPALAAALDGSSDLNMRPIRVPSLTLIDGEDAALKNGVMEFEDRIAVITRTDFASQLDTWAESTPLFGTSRSFTIAGTGSLDTSGAAPIAPSAVTRTGAGTLTPGTGATSTVATTVTAGTLIVSSGVKSNESLTTGGDMVAINGIASVKKSQPASEPLTGERLNVSGGGAISGSGGAFRGGVTASEEKGDSSATSMSVASTGTTSVGKGAASLQDLGSTSTAAVDGNTPMSRAPAPLAPAPRTASALGLPAGVATAAPADPAAPVSAPAPAAPPVTLSAAMPAAAPAPAMPATPMAGPAPVATTSPAKPAPVVASNPTSGARPMDNTSYFDQLGDLSKESAGAGVATERFRKIKPQPNATDKSPASKSGYSLDSPSLASNTPDPAGATPAEQSIRRGTITITPDSIDGLLVTDMNGRAKRLEEAEKEGVIVNNLSLAQRTAGETYTRIYENPFQMVAQEPLSTFSIDVDTASYANVRRFLNNGQRPPADAVRLEELINYFPYNYEAPDEGGKPFSVTVDMAEAPWQPLHRLARIALKGREIRQERGAANFVFLVDVSGSMDDPAKLPLVKQSLQMLTEQIKGTDRVAIVTYAGESGVTLPSTPGSQRSKIQEAIDRLHAGGSTNGASGIRLAYEQAAANFVKEGINRVILCTDGDFNVGISSPEELEKLIAEKAKSRVFLSVLGYGTGNLKDRTMETLADKGNGNYAYIDSLSEARKVLVEQMNATLVTIAKDVKIQVEFNPTQVAAYRLLGYENRALAKQDFNNDRKDAGEIGAGHTVTALYEIVPASARLLSPDGRPLVDELKYAQKNAPASPEPVGGVADAPTAPAAPAAKAAPPAASGETMTVKLRFKAPEGDKSELLEVPVTDKEKKLADSPRDFQFAAGVAGFGMLLRNSQHASELTWEMVRDLTLRGKGEDPQGYRGEFLQLIDKARGLTQGERQ